MKTINKRISQLKIIFIAIIFAVLQPLWAELPKPTSDYINDFANIISTGDYANIEGNLQAL